MVDLQALITQRRELDRQIAEAQGAARSSAIEKIRALMAENGLTLADIAGRDRQPRRAAAAKQGSSVAPKYRDSAGNTWTGRGLKPKWMQAAIAQGAKAEDFLIHP